MSKRARDETQTSKLAWGTRWYKTIDEALQNMGNNKVLVHWDEEVDKRSFGSFADHFDLLNILTKYRGGVSFSEICTGECLLFATVKSKSTHEDDLSEFRTCFLAVFAETLRSYGVSFDPLAVRLSRSASATSLGDFHFIYTRCKTMSHLVQRAFWERWTAFRKSIWPSMTEEVDMDAYGKRAWLRTINSREIGTDRAQVRVTEFGSFTDEEKYVWESFITRTDGADCDITNKLPAVDPEVALEAKVPLQKRACQGVASELWSAEFYKQLIADKCADYSLDSFQTETQIKLKNAPNIICPFGQKHASTGEGYITKNGTFVYFRCRSMNCKGKSLEIFRQHKAFDEKDDFNWSSFREFYLRRDVVFPSREAAIKHVAANMYRVFACCQKPSCYVIKVHRDEGLFEPHKQSEFRSSGASFDFHIRFKGDGKHPVESVKFLKLLEGDADAAVEFKGRHLYNQMDYYPGEVPKDAFNLFRGVRFVPLPEEQIDETQFSDFMHVIEEAWCGHEPTPQKRLSMKYFLLRYFRGVLVELRRLETCLFVCGKPGSGKNFVIEVLIAILGGRLYHRYNGIGEFLDRFNDYKAGKVLWSIDEMQTDTGRFIDKFDSMKSAITVPQVRQETKHLRAILVRNMGNVVYTSNHDSAIYIERGCRRIQVIHVKHCHEPRDFWRRMHEVFLKNETALHHLYSYLFHLAKKLPEAMDPKYDPIEIYETSLRGVIQNQCDTVVNRWVRDFVQSKVYSEKGVKKLVPSGGAEFAVKDLFRWFMEWVTECNEKTTVTYNKFRTELEKNYALIGRETNGDSGSRFVFRIDPAQI